MRIPCRYSMLIGCLLPLMASSVAVAQKAPEIAYVYPPGAQVGSTVSVQLGGYDWTEDMELFCLSSSATLQLTGPGSEMLVPAPPYWFGPKATSAKAFLIPREFPAFFTIPANTPPGPIYWQAANANGATQAGLFIIGNDPEIVEDQHRLKSQQLSRLPVVVNGRIMAIEEVDRYQLSVSETTLVTVELFARRIGSPLHAVLEVRNQSGNIITSAIDTEGVDSSVSFLARKNERYELALHDLDFRGNLSYVYRLHCKTGPQVIATIPAVVQRGQATKVEFIGRGLNSGIAEIESIQRTISIPDRTNGNRFSGKIRLNPIPSTGGQSIPFTIPLSDIPEQIADFGNSQTIPLSCPSGITARFTSGVDQHTYEVAGNVGDRWTIAAQAWRFGSLLDLSVEILDSTGKVLASNDDLPQTTDAGVDFEVPSEGKYAIVVTDNSLVADRLTSIYRLSIEKPVDDFALSIPQTATILLGGEYKLPVTAKRGNTFKGPISLSVSGLPPGVSAPNRTTIEADQTNGEITLKCDNETAVHASLVTVIGSALVASQKVNRVAMAVTNRNPVPQNKQDTEISAMLLAVTMKPRAEAGSSNPGVSRTAHRGTTYPAEIRVKRLEGFEGPVTVRMSAYQQRHRQGMSARAVVVPAGVNESVLPCYLPEWLETNRTSRMRMVSITEIADPQGNVRQLLNYKDDAISLSLEGALLKLSHVDHERIVTPGDAIEIPINVLRSVDLPETVQLELIVPQSLKGALQAKSVQVPAASKRARITVLTNIDSRLVGLKRLTIRGTAMQSEKYTTISQTNVKVFFKPRDRATSPR